MTEGRPVANFSVDVQTDLDGSLVLQPHGAIEAVPFRRLLVHAIRHVRPVRLVIDLGDIAEVDGIDLGTLAALCDQLNQTASRYPGTDLILRYEVKPHPGIA